MPHTTDDNLLPIRAHLHMSANLGNACWVSIGLIVEIWDNINTMTFPILSFPGCLGSHKIVDL